MQRGTHACCVYFTSCVGVHLSRGRKRRRAMGRDGANSGATVEVIVDLAAKSDEGGWQGSITIPGLGIKGAPLSDIALNGDNIAFSIKSALAEQRTGPA